MHCRNALIAALAVALIVPTGLTFAQTVDDADPTKTAAFADGVAGYIYAYPLVLMGMTERVVVPLEAGDIDEAYRAPAAALFERQERFELLGEPPEVHQLRFGIAVGPFGELGHQLFEVLGSQVGAIEPEANATDDLVRKR